MTGVSVGAILSEARAAAQMSIRDVAALTKIRASILIAMEADDFSHCGGAVYAKGQVRSIALAVGADPTPILDEFDAQSAM
jgi:cytoskeleton protein RodZ